MDAILFSAQPSMVTIDDAIRHLATHDELYWEVGFRIAKPAFTFPILGFIHMCGRQVEYRVTIRDIVPHSSEHYTHTAIAERVKPPGWVRDWNNNVDETQNRPWKTALVMTKIETFSYDTYAFCKPDGSPIQSAPRSYTRVQPPTETPHTEPTETPKAKPTTNSASSITERQFEDILVHQLHAIESGLTLVERQMNTPAGRLDLLCKDANGNYVVVELKRAQGSDLVVGQILRYMGWITEHYNTQKVRGIVVVAKKDPTLAYAVMAVPNVQVKEFKITVE